MKEVDAKVSTEETSDSKSQYLADADSKSRAPVASSGRRQTGFSLSLMFLLTAMFAILIAAVGPSLQPADGVTIRWGAVIRWILTFGGFTILFAFIYGFYNANYWQGVLFGILAALVTALVGPLMAILTTQQLNTSMVAIVVGSGLLVLMASLIRTAETD